MRRPGGPATFRVMSESHWAWSHDLPGQERRLLHVKGPDALRFLQGLLSQDVDAIAVGEARGACLLTVKGKISFDLAVLRPSEHEYWLAIPVAQAEACMDKLDRHLIMDEVELVWGEERLAYAWGAIPAEGVWRPFTATYPVKGWLLVGDSELSGNADGADFDAHRVSQAVPATGHEVLEGRFPPEVGFVDAVSYTKGCFMGQEPLSRMHSRGQSNWVMARVRRREGEVSSLPTALSHADREKAGDLTTMAGSEGLAILHRKVTRPGERLQSADGVIFEVTSEPLGQDEGISAGKAAVVQLGGKR